MWYLQFHLVCAKLLVSMISFFIDLILQLCFFVRDWQVSYILTQLEDFSHR